MHELTDNPPPAASDGASMPRRQALARIIGGLAALRLEPGLAQPSAADFIGGEVVKIDAEQGTVRLRHDPIAHLHLPATTTTFRYVDPRLILRIKDGDRIRFRADRYDGTLRLVAVVPMGAGARP